MAEYKSVHYKRPVPNVNENFEIVCSPDTDVWEKPPSTHSFNAPIIYQTTTKAAFGSAEITVTGQWKHKYDQGGLALILNAPDRRRWIKTGIEFYESKPYFSSVATDHWSDWALTPTLNGSDRAKIRIQPTDGALWIFLVGDDGSSVPVREVAWWAALPDETEIWVGPYAAKPAKEQEDLVVQFSDFKVSSK